MLSKITTFFRQGLVLYGLIFVAHGEEINKRGLFRGSVARFDRENYLLRIYAPFPNNKYLKIRNKVKFWDDSMHATRCESFILARGGDYFLLEIPRYRFCINQSFTALGAKLWFYSDDLASNIAKGEKLVKVLLQKRLVIKGKLAEMDKGIKDMAKKWTKSMKNTPPSKMLYPLDGFRP